MAKAKALIVWFMLFLLALLLLSFSIQGKLAMLLSIALLPDNVVVINKGT